MLKADDNWVKRVDYLPTVIDGYGVVSLLVKKSNRRVLSKLRGLWELWKEQIH